MRCVVALARPVASTTSVNREWVSAASSTSSVFALALADLVPAEFSSVAATSMSMLIFGSSLLSDCE